MNMKVAKKLTGVLNKMPVRFILVVAEAKVN